MKNLQPKFAKCSSKDVFLQGPKVNTSFETHSMNNICIIGAGQLGSRHLQALKMVLQPLLITVVDPSSESLKMAEERYQAAAGSGNHQL